MSGSRTGRQCELSNTKFPWVGFKLVSWRRSQWRPGTHGATLRAILRVNRFQWYGHTLQHHTQLARLSFQSPHEHRRVKRGCCQPISVCYEPVARPNPILTTSTYASSAIIKEKVKRDQATMRWNGRSNLTWCCQAEQKNGQKHRYDCVFDTAAHEFWNEKKSGVICLPVPGSWC